jgi:hypothetical protein
MAKTGRNGHLLSSHSQWQLPWSKISAVYQLLLLTYTARFGLQQQRNVKNFHMATTDRESCQQCSEEI